MFRYLSRKTNSLAFIPEIDGLRFFAIVTVVIYHLNSALSESLGFDWKAFYGVANYADVGWWLVRLDLGVKVFFAISGFILSMPFLKHYLTGSKKVDLGSYFVRRLLRLEAPFIVSLIVFFVGQVFLMNVDAVEYSKHLFANLFYAHGFIYGYPSPINPVTWSLETEAQFYIFIPFFISTVFFFKKKWVSLVLLAFTFILGLYLRKYIFGNQMSHFTSSMLVYMTNFLVGILFAWVFIIKRHYFERRSILFDFIGIIAIYGLFMFYKPQIIIQNNFIFNLCVFVFIASVFKGKLLNWFFTRRVVFTIGGMCYTIYLIHFGLLHFMAQKIAVHLNGFGYNIQLLIFALVSMVVIGVASILFFITIEKPCMDKDWPKKIKYYLKKTQ
jgi:peptidoglycan/LPS O-acetylase OafA/YrhL